MTTKRKYNGFIKNKEHLEYAQLRHYEKALAAEDIAMEEFYVQSVFNSPSHADNLRKEIFQKKIRHKVTNKVEPDSIIVTTNSTLANQILSQESINGVQYSRVSEDTFIDSSTDYIFEPDVITSIKYLLRELVASCDQEQLKVLAYFIVCENIDIIVVEDLNTDNLLDDLRVYILQIWELEVNNINSLNKFIGSKYKAEVARKSLSTMLKDKFPLLDKTQE